MLGRCFLLNYRLPTVTVIFPSEFVRFRLTEYVPLVFIYGIPVFVSVQSKNMKVKTGYMFFRPLSGLDTYLCSMRL
jgi:hypothetical protein